jgi:hypothetical protein
MSGEEMCKLDCSKTWHLKEAYLREGTIVPEVTLMGEAVADEAEFALLDVLLDRVEGLLLGDLEYENRYVSVLS